MSNAWFQSWAFTHAEALRWIFAEEWQDEAHVKLRSVQTSKPSSKQHTTGLRGFESTVKALQSVTYVNRLIKWPLPPYLALSHSYNMKAHVGVDRDRGGSWWWITMVDPSGTGSWRWIVEYILTCGSLWAFYFLFTLLKVVLVVFPYSCWRLRAEDVTPC